MRVNRTSCVEGTERRSVNPCRSGWCRDGGRYVGQSQWPLTCTLAELLEPLTGKGTCKSKCRMSVWATPHLVGSKIETLSWSGHEPSMMLRVPRADCRASRSGLESKLESESKSRGAAKFFEKYKSRRRSATRRWFPES